LPNNKTDKLHKTAAIKHIDMLVHVSIEISHYFPSQYNEKLLVKLQECIQYKFNSQQQE